MIHAGFPSFSGMGLEDSHIPDFWIRISAKNQEIKGSDWVAALLCPGLSLHPRADMDVDP